ncbi:MAG: universal stress protein [Actinomycetota bacterium]|nr:universal stress protein [Actinomycetota bacterium]
MYKKILIATDGSATAAKAAERGVSLAKDAGAAVILLCVGETPASENVARKVASELPGSVPITTMARAGDPADVICTVAEEEKVDLIVVGNKGMNDAKRFLIGNVPNQVSHHAPCNVLIVKTT